MTPPIDLLTVASNRNHAAQAVLEATSYMQSGPAAEQAMQHALAGYLLTQRDIRRVHDLIQELAE